ncbi:putative response regulator and transcription factor RR-A-type family [Helianthus annuus]|nr:putative response regulator and transcription factor RR-A-type family [Helianthus annuus]
MRSVGASTSVPATYSSAELNHHNRKELKEVRDGAAFNGQIVSEEDESRVNGDVNGGRKIELVKSQDAVKRQQQQQPQGPVIQWERFLPLRSLKVLLVEDDDSTRQVVSALLRNCSYEVTAVANGLEAWKVLIDLNKQIDLVLTEVVMPYLSGIGLLTKIMNLVPRKNIPVIMMSSDDSMGIVFNCLSKGAVDFLVKPIRKNELKNLWQHVWRKCHSSSGSESESGVGAHKPTNARRIEVSDDDSDDSDEDDDRSIGLTAKDGSDDGSGTQSSWTKKAVEVENTKYSWDQLTGAPDSTCAQVIHARPAREHAGEDDKLGKDLEIGAPRNSEKKIESNLKEASEPRTKSVNNGMVAKANESLNNKGPPALELSLKRPLDLEDTDTSTHKRNVLKQSDLSAFSRYNTTSNANQAPTANVGSCSPRLAQREAALNKFRQKKKKRCFEKKVRYQSRKKLAEQRPRVRGQFVRQGVNGKDADS